MGVTSLSDPMSAKLYLWCKGLGLWLWGEIARLRMWISGLCVCVSVDANECELSPVVAGLYCSAALLLLRALLSHRGRLLSQRFSSSNTQLENSTSSPWAVSFLSLFVSPEPWHTYASHIKDRDVRRDEVRGGWLQGGEWRWTEMKETVIWVWADEDEDVYFVAVRETVQQCQRIFWKVSFS